MSRAFSLSETEALLLVDADNAFNNINRKVALHNVERICPSFYRFLFNSYQVPVKLFISGSRKFIWSKEGATQGDPAAMAFYALATRPLMDVLAKIGKIIIYLYQKIVFVPKNCVLRSKRRFSLGSCDSGRGGSGLSPQVSSLAAEPGVPGLDTDEDSHSFSHAPPLP